MTAVRRVALYTALALCGGVAEATETIEVKLGSCEAGIQLVASDARLSKALDRLAEALNMRIDAASLPDRIVNVRLSGMAPDVIARLLSPHEPFMMTTARDPRCPGQLRIARLWLFPQGMQAQGRPPTAAGPPPATLTATHEQLREADRSAARLKEAYDAYVRRHGQPPPGVEEEVAKP